MSYFKVEQLFEFAFSSKLAYILPETVKKMLIDLESCLEVTDSPQTEYVERERKDNRDQKRVETYRNRYDFEPAGREKDSKKKRDFKKGGGSEWKHTPASTVSAREDQVDAEWELMRAFKPTKIETKTGIDKRLNDIRITLNKISTSNYDKQRNAVFELVNGYFQSDEEKTDVNTMRISKTIFDIASTNKFYSEMYAKLYKELVDAYAVFRELLDDLIRGFIAMDTIPVYVDPDTDYDGFCSYSKACEIRKSTSTFIVNCFKLGVIPDSRVTDVLSEFVKYVYDRRSETDFAKSIEEVVENIYIIATLSGGDLSKNAKWCDYILPTIQLFVSEKDGNYLSMSNRAVFKLMDILDKLK